MDVNEFFKQKNRDEQLADIDAAKALTREMRHEVDKYTKLATLAFADEVELVKRYIYSHRITFYLNDAMKWRRIMDDGVPAQLTKEQNEYREAFDRVVEFVSEFATGNKECVLEIPEISQQGYECSGWNIKFSFIDKMFEFTLPNIDKLDTDNYYYSHEGKFWIGVYVNSYCVEQVASSYSIDDLQKEFMNLFHL
ncbi:MAG: hypothetical protein MJZ25_09200 [Fibrobacter sp.]|nr:hypothetical protein [Fibrobacter sp.]